MFIELLLEKFRRDSARHLPSFGMFLGILTATVEGAHVVHPLDVLERFTLQPFDLIVPLVILKGQIQLSREPGTDVVDMNPYDIARLVNDFNPLTLFAANN